MESIFLLVLISLGTGFFLIFLLALSDKKRRGRMPLTEKSAFRKTDFEKLCVQVIEEMKLEILELFRSGDRQLDMTVNNPTPITGGQFSVHCLYLEPDEVVGSAEIIEFSNLIIQERLSKGIFMTTGRFTPDLPTIGELAPIEFVDGPAFWKLVKKQIPDYVQDRVIRS